MKQLPADVCCQHDAELGRARTWRRASGTAPRCALGREHTGPGGMGKHKKEQAKAAAKASDSSRLYIAAAVVVAVLGAVAAGLIDFSAAQPEKAPAAVMERPPPVERATAKSKAQSSDPADVGTQPAERAAAERAVAERAAAEKAAAERVAVEKASAERAAAADGKRDKHSNCALWAAAGECANNPAYMGSDCAASCRGRLPEQSAPAVAGGEAQLEGASLEPEPDGLASLWPAPRLAPDLERAQAESDARGPRPESRILHGAAACVDLRDDCASLARHNLSGCGEARAIEHSTVGDGVCAACARRTRTPHAHRALSRRP